MERWRPILYALGVAGALLLVLITWPRHWWPMGPGATGPEFAAAQAEPPIFIYVDADQRILMDDPDRQGWVAVAEGDVVAHLQRLRQTGYQRPVEIVAEDSADKDFVVALLDQARHAGAPSLSIAPVRPADQNDGDMR